jgi:hypothetical protein
VQSSGRWIASLSNGETIFEEPVQPGALSPWQALLQRCRDEQLSITRLRLQMVGVTVTALANASGFVQCSEMHRDLQTKVERHRRGIGSVIGDVVVINWIDDSRNVWQDVRPLADLKLHSTLA